MLDTVSYVHVLMESGREHFLPSEHHEPLTKAIDARVGWYRCANVYEAPVSIRPARVESIEFVTPTTRAQGRAFMAVVYPDEWEHEQSEQRKPDDDDESWRTP